MPTMSRARTRQIEGGIEREYRGRGRSAADSRYIAGAVMGNIKRERAAKNVSRACLEREYYSTHSGRFDRKAFDRAVRRCSKK